MAAHHHEVASGEVAAALAGSLFSTHRPIVANDFNAKLHVWCKTTAISDHFLNEPLVIEFDRMCK